MADSEKNTQTAPRPQASTPKDTHPTRAVETMVTKDVQTATAADVERASTDLPVPPKAVAEAKGEIPVSGSVQEGDDVVRRNDVQGTLGPVAVQTEFPLSEGVRQELLLHGAATDPATGRLLTRDDLPSDDK